MLRRVCVPMLLHEQLMLVMHWRHVMGRIKMLLLLHLLLLLCLLVRMLMGMVWMLRLRMWTLRRVTAQMLRLLLRLLLLLLRWWLLLVLMIEQLMLLIRTSSSSLASRFKVKLTLLLATKAVHSLQVQFRRAIVGGMAMWHLWRLWYLLLLLLRWWWRCSSNMLLLLLMVQCILLLLRWRLLLLLLQLVRIKALIVHGILLRFAGGHRML